MDYKQLSMLDIAYDLLTNRKEQIDFKELYDEDGDVEDYIDEEEHDDGTFADTDSFDD